MRCQVVYLVGTALAAVLLAASPATARTDAMKVVGGVVASFDDVPRLSSYFGVVATIGDDGTTSGQFTCVITDYMIILGNLNRSTLNDDGSVKLEGISDVFLLQTGEVTERVPYSVVVSEGGPKAGRLLMQLASEPSDSQTVVLGSIQIVNPSAFSP